MFIEKPLSTNVQEAVDIVGLARGRDRKVGVGHQYRLRPSLIEARKRVTGGAIGPLRLVTGVLAQPWLEAHGGPENSWRFDPKVAGGGILADSGDHLIDALLWTTGRVAVEAAAFQTRLEPGLDLVTAATVRLADGTPGDAGRLGRLDRPRLRDQLLWRKRPAPRHRAGLEEQPGVGPPRAVDLPETDESIDGNFVSAVRDGTPLVCPADQALDTVRLLEAIARSAATGRVVRLS